MGHDINVCKGDVQIAYYRANAFNPDARRIYKVLNCENYDGGVSGLGGSEWFSKEQILDAFTFCDTLNWERERDFFAKIRDNMDTDKVKIGFY